MGFKKGTPSFAYLRCWMSHVWLFPISTHSRPALGCVNSCMALWLPVGLVPWESPGGEKRQEESEVREVIPQVLPLSGSAAKGHGSHQEVLPDSSNCPLLAYSGIGMVMAAWGTVLSLAGFPKSFPIPLHVIH